MNWCFLGGTPQGVELLRAAIDVLDVPCFVSAPEGLSESDKNMLSSYCAHIGVPMISVRTAFDRLAVDMTMRGLVCRYPIIPRSLLTKARFLNLHNSLLPRWRGVHPLQWALLSGDAEAGITYHLCEPKVDSGGICLQQSFAIEPEDDINVLFERVLTMTVQTARPAIDNWLAGQTFVQKSEDKLPYAKRLDGSTQALTGQQSFHVIHRIVKISQPPWPRAYFKDANGKIEVLSASKHEIGQSQDTAVKRDGVTLFFDSKEDAQRVSSLLKQ